MKLDGRNTSQNNKIQGDNVMYVNKCKSLQYQTKTQD